MSRRQRAHTSRRLPSRARHLPARPLSTTGRPACDWIRGLQSLSPPARLPASVRPPCPGFFPVSCDQILVRPASCTMRVLCAQRVPCLPTYLATSGVWMNVDFANDTSTTPLQPRQRVLLVLHRCCRSSRARCACRAYASVFCLSPSLLRHRFLRADVSLGKGSQKYDLTDAEQKIMITFTNEQSK